MCKKTCRHIVDVVIGIDDTGHPIRAHGYTCGQPAITGNLCGTHLNQATGLTPPSGWRI